MDEKIKNHMRANKTYLKSQGVSFNANDLANELNDISEDYTGHRYGGGKNTGWDTRIHNDAEDVMNED